MGSSQRCIFLANYQFLWKTKCCICSSSHNVRIPQNAPRLGEEKEHLHMQRSKG